MLKSVLTKTNIDSCVINVKYTLEKSVYTTKYKIMKLNSRVVMEI